MPPLYRFDPFPELQTPRLTLRQLSDDDAPDILRLRSHPDVMKYEDRPLAKSLEDALVFLQKIKDGLQKQDAITWAISPKGSGRCVGTIGLWRGIPEHFRSEVGYDLHPDYHRQGLMGEALQAIIAYAWEATELHSIEAQVNPKNTASIGLLEKHGFVREGYFRENYFFAGTFLDTAVYSLVKTGEEKISV